MIVFVNIILSSLVPLVLFTGVIEDNYVFSKGGICHKVLMWCQSGADVAARWLPRCESEREWPKSKTKSLALVKKQKRGQKAENCDGSFLDQKASVSVKSIRNKACAHKLLLAVAILEL